MTTPGLCCACYRTQEHRAGIVFTLSQEQGQRPERLVTGFLVIRLFSDKYIFLLCKFTIKGKLNTKYFHNLSNNNRAGKGGLGS